MAGGLLAAVVPCFICGNRAERLSEGVESDQYQCEKGHLFGINWGDKPATEPQWPPSDKLRRIWEAEKQRWPK